MKKGVLLNAPVSSIVLKSVDLTLLVSIPIRQLR